MVYYIRILLLAYLLGISSAAHKKHLRRQRQQPAFLVPPSPFGSFSPRIQVQERASLVQVPPNTEPTVVFARITIPKNNGELNPPQQQPHQYQGPLHNYLIQQPQPQFQPLPLPTQVESLTPTTYRPPVTQFLAEQPHPQPTIIQNVEPLPPTHPSQVINVGPHPQQPQMITYYSNPHHPQLHHQHQQPYHPPGNSDQFVPTQNQLLPPHLVQHEGLHYTTQQNAVPIQPLQTMVYPHPQPTYHPQQAYHPHPQQAYHPHPHTPNGAGIGGSLVETLSSALKTTANLMTEYVPAFIKPVTHQNSIHPTPVINIPGFEVNLNHDQHQHQHQPHHEQVSYTKAKPGKQLFSLPSSLSQYYPYRKKYTAEKYAGSMPPPSKNPAPQFYPIVEQQQQQQEEAQISYPTYFLNSQQFQHSPPSHPHQNNIAGVEQMEASSSFHRPTMMHNIMQQPSRRKIKRVRIVQKSRIPKKLFLVKNSARPSWTILRSNSMA